MSDSERTAATSCSTSTSDIGGSDSSTICRNTPSKFSHALRSRPERGSSRRSTRGWQAKARPTSTRRRTPNGSAATGALATRVSRSCSRIASICSVSAFEGGSSERGSNMSRHRRVRSVRALWATTRCSRTVSPKKSSGCWNVRANPRFARARGEVCVTSSPWSVTRPAIGRCSPESTANSVDFPAPLGPTRPAMAPGLTARDTSESAVSPPKRTVMPAASSASGASGDGSSGPLVRVAAVVMTRAPRPRALPRPAVWRATGPRLRPTVHLPVAST